MGEGLLASSALLCSDLLKELAQHWIGIGIETRSGIGIDGGSVSETVPLLQDAVLDKV